MPIPDASTYKARITVISMAKTSEELQIKVKVKNIGTSTWYRDGDPSYDDAPVNIRCNYCDDISNISSPEFGVSPELNQGVAGYELAMNDNSYQLPQATVAADAEVTMILKVDWGLGTQGKASHIYYPSGIIRIHAVMEDKFWFSDHDTYCRFDIHNADAHVDGSDVSDMTEVTYQQIAGFDRENEVIRAISVDDQGRVLQSPMSSYDNVENKSQDIGISSVNITFTQDVHGIYIDNNSGNILYLNLAGGTASTTTDIPIRKNEYIFIEKKIAQATGISLIASSAGSNARIIGLY